MPASASRFALPASASRFAGRLEGGSISPSPGSAAPNEVTIVTELGCEGVGGRIEEGIGGAEERGGERRGEGGALWSARAPATPASPSEEPATSSEIFPLVSCWRSTFPSASIRTVLRFVFGSPFPMYRPFSSRTPFVARAFPPLDLALLFRRPPGRHRRTQLYGRGSAHPARSSASENEIRLSNHSVKRSTSRRDRIVVRRCWAASASATILPRRRGTLSPVTERNVLNAGLSKIAGSMERFTGENTRSLREKACFYESGRLEIGSSAMAFLVARMGGALSRKSASP